MTRAALVLTLLLPATLAPFTELRGLASLFVSRDYVARFTE